MPKTRRQFLQSSAALALGIAAGPTGSLAQQAPVQAPAPPLPDSQVQVPKMKFGSVEIGRLVLGVNPLYGFAHYNANFSSAMKEFYTQQKVCEVLHRANAVGINAFNYVNVGRAPQDWAQFQAEGGAMHLIIQDSAPDDAADLVKNLKPLAMHRQGEVVDVAWRNGQMDAIHDWCKRVRDMGVLVGVGTHKPEVIAFVEEKGWDVDFYAGCVYNRTRTPDEWRQILNGQLLEMPREIYLQSDPERMFKVIRQTPKPCFAFKILAAGRIADNAIEQAFRTAFSSIKPCDGVFVGMYPKVKDEIRENAAIVHKLLTSA